MIEGTVLKEVNDEAEDEDDEDDETVDDNGGGLMENFSFELSLCE